MRCAGSLLLLALVASRVDWPLVGGLLRQAQWLPALGAFLLFPGLIALLALRWFLFLRRAGLPVAPAAVLQLTWAGQFMNSVLPGSTGGDALKLVEICRLLPERRSDAAASVVLDRLAALAALALLGGIAATQVKASTLVDLWSAGTLPPWLWALLAVGLLMLGLAAVWILRSERWRTRLGQLAASLRAVARLDAGLGVGLLLSLAAHLTVVTIFWLIANALGLALGFGAALVVIPVVLVASLLPVTVNGHGLREVLLIGLLTALVPPAAGGPGMTERVFAISTVLITMDLLWNLPGGIAYLLLRRRSAAAPTG